MVLRLLARICAAKPELSSGSSDLLTRANYLPQGDGNVVSLANEVAVTSLQARLSGLSGSSLQRIAGMLAALQAADEPRNTHAALYAFPEEDLDSSMTLVLIGCAQSDVHDGLVPGLLPDVQQMALFRRMSNERVPVFDCIDRPSVASSLASGVSLLDCSTNPAEGALINPRKQQQLGSGQIFSSSSNAQPSGAKSPRLSLVAAIPILHGAKLAGALWLEQEVSTSVTLNITHLRRPAGNAAAAAGGNCALAAAAAPGAVPPSSRPLLADRHVLETLGFACSMCLAGLDGDQPRWLASVLARLGVSSNMSTLTVQLCACLAAHVRRRFVLEGHVTAALVPPHGAGGVPSPLALMLQPITSGGGAAPGAAAAAVPRADTLNANLTGSTAPTGAGAGGATAVWAKGVVAGMVRDQSVDTNVLHQRLSLDLTSLRRRGSNAAGATPTPGDFIPRSPSFLMASSRSVIIPLGTGEALNNTPHTSGGDAPVLHAKAFPLNRTLLQAYLQLRNQAALHQQQPPRPSQFSQPTSVTSPPGHASRSAVLGGGLASASAALAALNNVCVVEDTQRQVQNVHKPSGDVCLLLGMRQTATGMLASSAGASGVVSGTLGGGGGSAVTAASVAGGGGAAAAASSLPQSLVLVVLPLAGGAALGLYLGFPRRLPGQLLAAVRASCQELVDRALGPVFRMRLADRAISPEYETLCSANPGSYAVVCSQSISRLPQGPLSLPSALAAAYMSNTTISEGPGTAEGATPAVPSATRDGTAGEGTGVSRELLSSVLSTGDVDVLLYQQQQQSQQPNGRGGTGATSRRAPQTGPTPGSASLVVGAGGPSAASLPRKASNPSLVRMALSLANRSLGGGGTGASSASRATSTGLAAAATAGGGEFMEPLNLSQLLQSNTNDLLASLGAAGGTPGALSGGRSRSFLSPAGLEQVGLAPSSFITVAGADPGSAVARQQLDLLVSSIQATINTDPAAGGAGCSPLDDLEALELCEVLGQGGGGTVFRGKMGTLDVAVKLMELRPTEPPAAAKTAAAGAPRGQPQPPQSPPTPTQAQQPKAQPAGHRASPSQGQGPGQAPGTPPASPAAGTPTAAELVALDRLCLSARREMLRNATELAVQSRVSHPNIVQIYATYNDVVRLPRRGTPGKTYRLCPAACAVGAGAQEEEGGDSLRQVACVAATFELCDLGSLGAALAERTFPRPAAASYGAARRGCAVDMKSVYMTLLDVALALRHLHSLNLVHRDIKPANLLLKTNPRDHRGFTVKLADFGFVLHLSETAQDGTRYTISDQACGTVTHMAPEAMLGKAKIDASVDVYAFGILMWEMFSVGVRPFPRLLPDKIPRAVYRGARPTFSDDVPANYRSLAVACWGTEPHRRPKAAELVCILNAMLQEWEPAT